MSARETFTITRRWSWSFLGEIKVEIECDPLAPTPAKLGLAVRAAFKSGAVLSGADLRGAVLSGADLRGADLRDAVLRGADLRDADLRGADLRDADLRDAVLSGADLGGADLRDAVLSGADLRGAVLSDEKITRIFARVERNDGYTFMGAELQAGGVKIAAGCRWFTPAEYRAHVAAEYHGTNKAAETLRIIEFIEGRAADLGIGVKPKRVRKASSTKAELTQ